MASIRAERQRFLQSPFTFCLSKEAAKTRQSPRKPRRVVMCASCGSAKILGNAKGDYATRDVGKFFCDPDCVGIALAIIVAKDKSRPARRAEVAARNRKKSEAKRAEKNRIANLKCCLMCGKAHTKVAWCSKECAKLRARLRNRARQQRKRPVI
jgi:hypothetical protein